MTPSISVSITLIIVALLAALAPAAANGGTTGYHGHEVYRLAIASHAQLDALEMLEMRGAVDVWSEARVSVGALVDVRVAPWHRMEFRRTIIDTLRTAHEILIGNVGELIDAERVALASVPSFSGARNDTDFFAKYRTLDEFAQLLDSLHGRYPQLTELVTIGSTVEGRPIVGIKIRGQQSGNRNRKAIVLNGGQHAREWISPMVTAYIAHQLLARYHTDPQVKDLVDNLEWHIIPIVNADGYVFTWEGDRLWRKNRRINPGTSCRGVDPNRNWNYKWNATGGSSTNPCSETYRGPSPFSEPESTAIGTYTANVTNLRGYIDFHSYSQLWMRPWGFTEDAPKDEPVMKAVGDACVAAIERVHGKIYKSGRISIIIYPASGSSVDYVYGTTGAISFGVELRDTGRFGFLLPPDQIIPTGEENWEATVMTLGMHILQEK